MFVERNSVDSFDWPRANGLFPGSLPAEWTDDRAPLHACPSVVVLPRCPTVLFSLLHYIDTALLSVDWPKGTVH